MNNLIFVPIGGAFLLGAAAIYLLWRAIPAKKQSLFKVNIPGNMLRRGREAENIEREILERTLTGASRRA